MTVPVSKKFLHEFDEKKPKHKLFGCLRSRKVKKIEYAETTYYSPLVRSPASLDVSLIAKKGRSHEMAEELNRLEKEVLNDRQP